MLGSSPDNPLRCSKLGEIAKCTMRLYLLSQLPDFVDEEGGEAAQTGSLTHEGVAAFHKTQNKSLEERKRAAWEAINAARKKFPLADENETRLFITPYMDDARNINANCIAVEEEIHFTLSPHEIDESQLPIYVKGTLDQLRLINGQAYVYDLKTGKRSGWEMIHDYAIQMAAYTYGVREIGHGKGQIIIDGKKATPDISITNHPSFPNIKTHWNLWQNAKPGKIIRNHGYRTRTKTGTSPDGVFWELPFTIKELSDMLDGVRLAVALYRNGFVNYGPGGWCSWCEFGGLTGCTQRYNELQQLALRK